LSSLAQSTIIRDPAVAQAAGYLPPNRNDRIEIDPSVTRSAKK
jgi:hypothetical protein